MIQLERSRLRATLSLRRANAHLATLTDNDANTLVNGPKPRTSWRSMQKPLVEAQLQKCGWCESFLDSRAIEVDHIRPKAPTKYWWLAYELENLLAACRSCNNYKGDTWPLYRNPALIPRQLRSSHVERALIIDPTRENPGRHLSFGLDDAGRWVIRARTRRGLETIAALQLDRETLRNMLNEHYELVLAPRIDKLAAAVKDGNQAAFDAAALSLLDLAKPRREWSAFNSFIAGEALMGRL